VAAYSNYLNASVTVWYWLGNIFLSATGVFVGDSGRSIFLEQHIEQHGRRNYFRWEIPYGSIHSVETARETIKGAAAVEQPEQVQAKAATAGAGQSQTNSASILPVTRPRQTA